MPRIFFWGPCYEERLNGFDEDCRKFKEFSIMTSVSLINDKVFQ